MDKTIHKIIKANSNNLQDISDESVNLIVTSPPYPMIEMWDEQFSIQDSTIYDDLSSGDGLSAFYKMHKILNSVWDECDRVLIPNGFICINIGDATRTIGDIFQLYSNHTQVINYFSKKGYSILPDVHWRKPSNAPNKFMGSGMYPAGAYVTYEHEYILIFRKGNKRVFCGEEKIRRQRSAYFWEERNIWFSDLWEIKGTQQNIKKSRGNRDRSAAFPFEIPYRLVNMYSVEGDTVLDPFAGLCTTSLACMCAKRNSICVDIDSEIIRTAYGRLKNSQDDLNQLIKSRIIKHFEFVDSLSEEKKEQCYINDSHGFLVKTRQEKAIKIELLDYIEFTADMFKCGYHAFTK